MVPDATGEEVRGEGERGEEKQRVGEVQAKVDGAEGSDPRGMAEQDEERAEDASLRVRMRTAMAQARARWRRGTAAKVQKTRARTQRRSMPLEARWANSMRVATAG